MIGQTIRAKNILDEGVKHHERVIVNGVVGKIVGVDFNEQMVQIEINVPAHCVKREEMKANSKPEPSL